MISRALLHPTRRNLGRDPLGKTLPLTVFPRPCPLATMGCQDSKAAQPIKANEEPKPARHSGRSAKQRWEPGKTRGMREPQNGH
eukprot:5294808-Heterocapsa_arctica.AAC.1